MVMTLLLALAGYSGPHVALCRFLGASRQWFVLITCFAAFIIGEPEPRWPSRLRPLVATMPWGDIGVTKFTSDSLTIRGGSAVPGSALYQRDTHISSKVSTARQPWNGTPQLEPKPK
jgi:hypothetical protein